MKFPLLLLGVFLLQTAASSQKPSLHPFTLTGVINGIDSGYIYINYIPDGNMGIYDSCKIRKGHFAFKGSVVEPTKAWFYILPAQASLMEKNRTQFYIEPADMKLYARYNQFNQLRVEGSASDRDRMKLVNLEEPVQQGIDSLHERYLQYYSMYRNARKKKSDSLLAKEFLHQADSLDILIQDYDKQKTQIDSEFIVNNPDSYVAADMLAHSSVNWIAFPSLDSLYNRFPKFIQESFPGKKVQFEIERVKKVPVGSNATNFVAIDNKGDTVSLSDYTNKKYVLLDFGASWCAPCRDIIPLLKRDYAKYDTALEIISIANQKEEDQWRKAIAEDKVSWPQIIENMQIMPLSPADKTITSAYYIDTTPSLILIDKNARIIGKYGGFYYSRNTWFQDFEAQLKKLFEK